MLSCASTGQEKPEKAFNGKWRAIMSTRKCHQWPLQKDRIIRTIYFFCSYSAIQCTLHLHKEQAPRSGSPSAHCACTKTFFLCNEQRYQALRTVQPALSWSQSQTLLDLSNLPSTPRTPVRPRNTVDARVAVPPPCVHAAEGNPLVDAEAVGFGVKLRFIRDCIELMKAVSGEQKKTLWALEADEVIFEQGSLDYVERCTDIAMDVMLDKTMNKFGFSIIDNDYLLPADGTASTSTSVDTYDLVNRKRQLAKLWSMLVKQAVPSVEGTNKNKYLATSKSAEAIPSHLLEYSDWSVEYLHSFCHHTKERHPWFHPTRLDSRQRLRSKRPLQLRALRAYPGPVFTENFIIITFGYALGGNSGTRFFEARDRVLEFQMCGLLDGSNGICGIVYVCFCHLGHPAIAKTPTFTMTDSEGFVLNQPETSRKASAKQPRRFAQLDEVFPALVFAIHSAAATPSSASYSSHLWHSGGQYLSSVQLGPTFTGTKTPGIGEWCALQRNDYVMWVGAIADYMTKKRQDEPFRPVFSDILPAPS
ncbi:hypothetical protein EDC04DRAFT_2604418 [Pisolithus marmoratus]|nr:hypothetical protein EDC04DRAFT_2604418 [Pisolithus marmoratus]